MKTSVMTSAAQPALRTPSGLPAPKARPTRTVAAWLSPSGTMKVIEASCSAMACAATASWPIQPCSSEAEVNSSTSASDIRPIGMPIAQQLDEARPVGAEEIVQDVVAAEAPVPQRVASISASMTKLTVRRGDARAGELEPRKTPVAEDQRIVGRRH